MHGRAEVMFHQVHGGIHLGVRPDQCVAYRGIALEPAAEVDVVVDAAHDRAAPTVHVGIDAPHDPVDRCDADLRQCFPVGCHRQQVHQQDACGIDEHEAVDPIRVAVGEIQADRTAQGMADDMGPTAACTAAHHLVEHPVESGERMPVAQRLR